MKDSKSVVSSESLDSAHRLTISDVPTRIHLRPAHCETNLQTSSHIKLITYAHRSRVNVTGVDTFRSHSGHSVCVKRSIDLEHLTSNQVATGSIPERLGLNVSLSGRSALFVLGAVHPGSLLAGDSALEDRL